MVELTRSDLGGTSTGALGTPIAAIVHLSDLHVLDAASPARAEWVELLGHEPLWRPLLHLHRPYDALTLQAVYAHLTTIREQPVGPATGRPIDLVISTGDNIDNGQRNELDAYLALFAGGVAALSGFGSAQDPHADPSLRPWPYWSPDPAVDDTWRHLGYPAVDDFVARVSAPITAVPLGLPWTSVPGNHDLMRQGTALPSPPIEAIAVGATKSLRRPVGFTPADPLGWYLDHPEDFSTGPGHVIARDERRRAIDRREWIDAHAAAGASGFRTVGAVDRTIDTMLDTTVDSVVDTEHVRFVLLDTNHPDGDYQGSIGDGQLAWLDEQLAAVDREPGRVAVLVSHHGADTLVNERGERTDRRLADGLLDVVHRHPAVVAWLVGHRHINRIEPRPGPAGGFWEITTCSIIDWPSQTRSIEMVRHRDSSIEMICTMRDHDDPPDGLAALHRDLAHRFTTTGVATRMAGRVGDADVRLLLPPR